MEIVLAPPGRHLALEIRATGQQLGDEAGIRCVLRGGTPLEHDLGPRRVKFGSEAVRERFVNELPFPRSRSTTLRRGKSLSNMSQHTGFPHPALPLIRGLLAKRGSLKTEVADLGMSRGELGIRCHQPLCRIVRCELSQNGLQLRPRRVSFNEDTMRLQR